MKIPNFRLEKLKKKLRVLYTKRQHVRLEINDGQLLLLIIHVVTVVTLLHCWLLNQSVIEFIVTSIADATHVVHCSLLNYPVLHVFISHMMKNKILLFFFCSVLLRMNRKRGEGETAKYGHATNCCCCCVAISPQPLFGVLLKINC